MYQNWVVYSSFLPYCHLLCLYHFIQIGVHNFLFSLMYFFILIIICCISFDCNCLLLCEALLSAFVVFKNSLCLIWFDSDFDFTLWCWYLNSTVSENFFHPCLVVWSTVCFSTPWCNQLQTVLPQSHLEAPYKAECWFSNSGCCSVKVQSMLIRASLVSLPTAANTAPYGSTGSAYVPLACRYLVLALSSFISVY